MKTKNNFLAKIANFLMFPAVMLIMMIALTSHSQAAGAKVAINANTFPNYNFRHYIETEFDDLITIENGTKYLTPDAISKIKVIKVNGTDSKSYADKNGALTGIEYFTSLEELYCTDNKLKTINLIPLTKLKKLVCYNNSLNYLNVSYCPQLRVIECQNNQLTTLNLSKNTKLTELNCRNNKIATLGLDSNTKLTKLSCHQNKLTFLNVSKCTSLTNLTCYDNSLRTLNLSSNRKLKYVSCENNVLESLDVTGCVSLISLDCSNNLLKGIDLNHNPNLTSLICYSNDLSALSLRNNKVLEEVYCYDNDFYNLEINKNGKLHKAVKKAKKTSSGSRYIYTNKSTNAIILWMDKKTTIYTLDANVIENPDVDEAGVRKFVNGFYYTLLERGPVNHEEEEWIKRLVSRTTNGEAIARGFVFSDEFQNKHYSNRTFVTKMYQTFLGRSPKNNEEQGWVNHLEYGKSREFVLAGFVNSTEFDNACKKIGIVRGEMKVNNPNAPKPVDKDPNFPRLKIISTQNVNDAQLNAYIDRIYMNVLHRPADAAGREGWKKLILENQGEYNAITVPRKGFFESPEYINKSTSDEQFVTDAYLVFLGRTPDKEGLNAWVSRLRDGSFTRATMLDIGFGNSPEFQKILQSYGFVVGY